jgi:putative copper export protein
MNEMFSWPWAALFLLRAYHGINPGMGWLFAVGLGMQEKSSGAVWRALVPTSVGHAVAVGVVVALAGLFQAVLPLRSLKIGVAVILFAFGLYHLLRHRHPRYGGMQVG